MSLLLATAPPGAAHAHDVAVVGGVLIDVAQGGHSSQDIEDAVVVIRDGAIAAAGARRSTPVPHGAQVIDARGGYITPGLIDGYGALRSQAYADAYLEEGVTTVYVQPAAGRGEGEDEVAEIARGPRLFLGRTISGYATGLEAAKGQPWRPDRLGGARLDGAALAAEIDRAADAGARAIVLSFDLWPDQVDLAVREGRRRRLATIAEPAFTSYPYAVAAGVSALAHNDRYSTVTATPQQFLAYADDPMGKGGGPAFRAVCTADLQSPAIQAYAAQLAASKTAMMPILSIEDTADDLDGLNPWRLRSAAFFTPADLDDPVDPSTGARPYLDSHPDRRDALRACALRRQQLDRILHAAGATYLAGSGAPGYGIMPGSGLHEEVRLLHGIGLTPREALAAATSNFADAYGWPEVGRIEPGRAGDLLVLGSDPRLDVAALDDIRTVIHDGRIVDRRALLAAAAGRALRSARPAG